MPCNEVREIQSDLEHCSSALLQESLVTLGYQRNGSAWTKDGITVAANGKVSATYWVSAQQAADAVSAIKRQYARDVVSVMAKRYGWNKAPMAATSQGQRFILTKR